MDETSTQADYDVVYVAPEQFEKFRRSDRRFLIHNPETNNGYIKGDKISVCALDGSESVLLEAVGGTQVIRAGKIPQSILDSCKFDESDMKGLREQKYCGVTKIKEVAQ